MNNVHVRPLDRFLRVLTQTTCSRPTEVHFRARKCRINLLIPKMPQSRKFDQKWYFEYFEPKNYLYNIFTYTEVMRQFTNVLETVL